MDQKPKINFYHLSSQWIQYRLYAGFLFESLLFSFFKKNPTPFIFYIHLSEYLMVPVNDVIKKTTSCLKWLQIYHVLALKWFQLFGKIGVTVSTEISNSQMRKKKINQEEIYLVKIQG